MAEYIEREALILQFNLTAERSGEPDCPWDMSAIETEIEAMPAADVVPVVHGRWINKTNHNRAVVEQRVDCSACGHIFWHTSAMSYNYCPNCGAKMDGGDGNG